MTEVSRLEGQDDPYHQVTPDINGNMDSFSAVHAPGVFELMHRNPGDPGVAEQGFEPYEVAQ